MAGFLSSSDIEDVVSSVRRLVSVDGRPRPVTRDLAADRLLLTPALQVVADSQADAPDVAAAADMVVATPAEPDPSEDAPPVPEPVAVDADTLPDAAEPVVDDGPVVTETAAPDAVLAEALVVEGPVADEGPADGVTAPEDAPIDPVAEDEAEEVGPEDAPVIAGPADVPDVAVEAEPGPVAPEPLHLVVDEWEDEIWAEADPSLAEIALGAEEAELLPPDLPAAGAGIFAVEDSAEPKVPPIDPDAAWAQIDGDWADDLPDPVVPFAPHRLRSLTQAQPPADQPPRSEAVELTDPDGNPLTILDEAALQEVVRQLIREELQGGLGERITRNVRKLVRAEINRALAARALD